MPDDPGGWVLMVRSRVRRSRPARLPGSMAMSTARYCRTRATASELLSFVFKGWGACPDTGTSTMMGKMIVGLAAVAIVSVATTMSASAQQKKITVAMPKQVCEMLTVDTENWGRQTVQLCGPPGGPRGQATIKQRQTKPKTLAK